MIQAFIQRRENAFDFGEIEKPTGMGIDLSFAKQFNAEAVPVQPGALVARWGVGQTMGGLKSELAGQANPTARCDSRRAGRSGGRCSCLEFRGASDHGLSLKGLISFFWIGGLTDNSSISKINVEFGGTLPG